MKKLIIYGLGPIAELAKYYFDSDSSYQVVAFTVETAYKDKEEFHTLPVIAFEELQVNYNPKDYHLFIAISYTQLNQLRESKYFEGKQKGYNFANYISSKATVLTTDIGENNFILEDNTIQPYVKIGDNNMIWSGNHIGHHSTIGSHNFIASHVVISGMVNITHHCFLGVNATLRNNITIAAHNIIGAGALVLKNTNPNEVYSAVATAVHTKTSDQVRL